jgi:hypothetical protein
LRGGHTAAALHFATSMSLPAIPEAAPHGTGTAQPQFHPMNLRLHAAA